MGIRRHGPLAVILTTLAVALVLASGATAQDPPPYALPLPPTPTATPTPDGDGDVPGNTDELLQPVPIVRIVGRLTARGARITRLTVKTPPLVRVVVRCKGAGCPFRRRTTIVPDSDRRVLTLRLRRMERAYRSGAVIEIAVMREGSIGKFARFRVRRGKVPRRTDSCIEYRRRRPSPCPGAGADDRAAVRRR